MLIAICLILATGRARPRIRTLKDLLKQDAARTLSNPTGSSEARPNAKQLCQKVKLRFLHIMSLADIIT